MLFSLTSRVVCSLAAFLYPGYASYKTLSQRPASEAELERWLMYWSVLGCVVGAEYLAEWAVSWIPLYSTWKAIFLLYIALPQTQGATYLYTIHLRPFFATHERQIDSTIAEVRGRAYRFIQEKARAIWVAVLGTLSANGDPTAQGAVPQGGRHSGGSRNEPPPEDAPAGPSALLSSLWGSYGPGIVAGGAALLRQTAAATLPGVAVAQPPPRQSQSRSNALHTPPGSTILGESLATDPFERRKQLEAELASLPDYTSTAHVPMPTANNPARASNASLTKSSSSSSTQSLRERTNSGKFEEIKDNDIAGYEIDDDDVMGGYPTGGSPSSQKSQGGGWFGWGGSTTKPGYERVKSD
ncbi:TB2/DP1, HVA22 family-domain-containing protein [Panaeolus papilionaceus]|nr:TB2/DP1, HVA22 family-domain-containing protein [Panaeolus papilionaceus]